MPICEVGLIGLGAIGAPLAIAFQNSIHQHFHIIAQGKRKERIEKGVVINNQTYQFSIIEPNENIKLDLIIICTKFNQLKQALDDIKNFVDDNTKILPFLNGVTSEEIIAKRFGKEKVIYGFTKVAAMNENHHITFSHPGCYYFGHPQNNIIENDIKKISHLFKKANIIHLIPEDMLAEKWFKFMCNVGENQVSAILDIPFGAWNVSEHANLLREKAGNEVHLIAKAKGIHFKQEWIDSQRALLNNVSYHNYCSMAQDIHAKRHSEVDMFALEVIKMGKAYHIPTPVNDMLYHMIKVLEEKNDGKI
ncbi:MAG: ketopantoate reductase family protein [Faecalibacillus sp.]